MKKTIENLRYTWGLALIFAITLISLLGMSVHADQVGVGYYIQPEIPTNQITGAAPSYFYLRVGEQDKQTLQMRVFNTTAKPLTLQQQIITAYTGDNAQIGYTPTIKPISFDKSLKYKLGDLVKLTSPEKFTIKPNSSAVVTAQIDSVLPKNFNGEILGSWFFVQDGGSDKQIGHNVTIKNDYAYESSISLIKGQLVLPDFKLLKARAIASTNQLGVGVTLQNPSQPRLRI